MKKINYKRLIISILIALAFGLVGTLLGGSTDIFNVINKPFFAPPKILFPIVWTILYIVMGISSYLVYEEKVNHETKKKALLFYFLQLTVNALWTLFFFRFQWFLFSYIWLLLLIVLVIIMILKFYDINKTSAYLQIPYLIWICFASLLNFAIYLLN